MPINFNCPHCARRLFALEHFAGKSAACPACGEPLKIPLLPPEQARLPGDSLLIDMERASADDDAPHGGGA